MEKRRVRLEINGIVCGIITEESDEYMKDVSESVGNLMRKIQKASPYITRESAALTVALSYCDEMQKSDDRLLKMKNRMHEMEKKMLEAQRVAVALKKENGQLWEETSVLLDRPEESVDAGKEELKRRVAELEAENTLLRQRKIEGTEKSFSEKTISTKPVKLKNPLRHDDYEQQGFVSFFEKNAKKEEYEEN